MLVLELLAELWELHSKRCMNSCRRFVSPMAIVCARKIDPYVSRPYDSLCCMDVLYASLLLS